MRTLVAARQALFLLSLAFGVNACSGCPGHDSTRDGGDDWDSAAQDAGPEYDAMTRQRLCGELVHPGPDPNAQHVPGSGHYENLGASMNGRYVAYSERRPGPEANVFLFDIEMSTVTQVTDSTGFDALCPYVFGNGVMWSDLRHGEYPDLYQYDIPTGVETRTEGWGYCPKFNDDYVVYVTTWEDLEIRSIAVSPRDIWDPYYLSTDICQGPEGYSIGRRYLSWVGRDPLVWESDTDVIFYHAESRWTHRVTGPDQANQHATSTDGGRIVWMDERNGNWDIYMYDIEQERETALTGDRFDQVTPHLSGDLLVFRDYLGREVSDCASELFVLDLSTMVRRRITTNPWHWSALSSVSQGRVLARDSDSPYYQNLWIFDLVEMGVLDPTGQHVLPE